MNDELPSGWAKTPIKEVVELNPKAQYPDNLEVGFVPMPLMGKRFGERAGFEVRKWGEVKKGYTHFQDGDVLLAKITPCFENGKGGLVAGLPNGVGAGSTEYFVSRPLEGHILPEYLLAYLKTPAFMSDGATQMTGSVGHKRVPKEFLLESQIPLAPIAEQKRIADKLEAVLGRVDACRARLDRVPALLKRFRQSVLAAATSGKLTEEWRMKNGVNDEWDAVEIGSLMESKPRNGYSPKAVDFETPVRSLTLTATTSGRFRGEHSKFINEEISPSSHLWLVPGDILIQRANTIEYVGVSAIFDGSPSKFIYPDLMMKCRANDQTTTGFLYLLLQSDPVRTHFRNNATGTAGNMPKINQGTVISAPVTLPTPPEQQEIVRRVEALFALADRIEARLAVLRKTADRLTPSVLAKAFRGELVPQDPKDEPASVLLERLQSQAAPQPARAPRKERASKASVLAD